MLNIRYHQAFTLPELLMAILTLSIVLTGAMSIFIYCTILTDNSRNLHQSIEEAHSKLEEIRNHDYDQIITDYHGTSFSLAQPSGATGTIAVNEVGADVAADLLQVDITVSWQNKNSRSNSSTISSMMSRR